MSIKLILLLIILIAIRFITALPHYRDGEMLRITAKLTTQPSAANGNQTLKIAGLRIKLPSYPEINYDDKIVVEGTVKNGELSNAKLISVTPTTGIFPRFRQWIIEIYQRTLPAPHGSLVAGIVIGAKSSIPQDLSNKLKNTGTSHAVVASGMNVTIVASFFLAILLKIMTRRKAIVITLCGILIYCLIVGFEAPIVRAAIMASITLVAQTVGRLANTVRTLLITTAIMLLIVPSWLTDVGFMLSVATTLSLILFEKKVDRLIHFVPDLFRESLSTSLAAQIGSAPIILFFFGRINIFSPLINALVLWTIPFIMFIGIVGIIVHPVLLLAYPLTSWFLLIINLFG